MNALSIDHFLGGPVDDLVQEMKNSSAWKEMMSDAADKVYDRIKQRVDQEKESLTSDTLKNVSPAVAKLASDTLAAVEPQLQKMAKDTLNVLEPEAKQALLNIFNDAETQARIGQTQEDIKSSVTNILIIGGVSIVAASSIATWLIVKNYSSKK